MVAYQNLSNVRVTDENFNERDYLASNPDVAQAVKEGRVGSGKKHFEKYGRQEGRKMRLTLDGQVKEIIDQQHTMEITVTPDNFNENDYLNSNPDIAQAVSDGRIASGKMHFEMYGRIEGRKIRVPLETQIKELTDRNRILESQLKDIHIFLQQTFSILRLVMNIPPPPPKHLQVRVAGAYDPGFLEAGFARFYPTLNRILLPTGKQLKDFEKILDFGCGCGRAIRGLAALIPGVKLYGTDIDTEAIEWMTTHYSKFGEYSVAPHLPPTVYEDQMFNFIFGISVFTHLPEEMQISWLKELARITKPGGYVILTTHGEKHYSGLGTEIVNLMNTKGFYFDNRYAYGQSISLPDFYQTAYHSHAYIRKEWGKYFDVIDVQALGLDNHQDTVLLQKSAKPGK